MASELAPGKVFVLSTNAAWQKCVAGAFTQQLQGSGLHADLRTFTMADGALNADALTSYNNVSRAKSRACCLPH